MKRRSKTREMVRGILATLAGFGFLLSMIAVAFFITRWLYGQFDYMPPALAAQLLNALLGLILAVAVVYVLVQLSGAARRSQELGMFRPIVEALERIAKGDFSVRLDNDLPMGVVGTLAQSVNAVALELDQLEKMRQEFISNVSHEIQSPLTSIRGFARALRDEQLAPGDRERYLTIIEDESVRLSKLSDNLLKLAALEALNMHFAPQSYRLDRQIRSVLLACEPQWSAKSLDVDIALDELSVTADADLLSQVWTNLIHNSIKFTPEGGSVRVELHRRLSEVVFRITDTGIGIAECDQAHIFERFFKADLARDRSQGGSGLGLAIAQKIVALHNGTISVASALGMGTTFTVSLPAE